MVEFLIIAGIIIGIRALYLWNTKGKDEANKFVNKGIKEVNKMAA